VVMAVPEKLDGEMPMTRSLYYSRRHYYAESPVRPASLFRLSSQPRRGPQLAAKLSKRMPTDSAGWAPGKWN